MHHVHAPLLPLPPLTSGNDERKAVKHEAVGAGGVGERHRVELDVALHLEQRAPRAVHVDARLAGDDAKQLRRSEGVFTEGENTRSTGGHFPARQQARKASRQGAHSSLTCSAATTPAAKKRRWGMAWPREKPPRMPAIRRDMTSPPAGVRDSGCSRQSGSRACMQACRASRPLSRACAEAEAQMIGSLPRSLTVVRALGHALRAKPCAQGDGAEEDAWRGRGGETTGRGGAG